MTTDDDIRALLKRLRDAEGFERSRLGHELRQAISERLDMQEEIGARSGHKCQPRLLTTLLDAAR